MEGFPHDERLAAAAAGLAEKIKHEFPTVTEIEFGFANEQARDLQDAQWWARARMVVRRGDERNPESFIVEDCWSPNEALAMLHLRLSYRFVPMDPETGEILRDSPLLKVDEAQPKRMSAASKMKGRLTDKQPGLHRWVAMATYALTDGQARMAAVPGTRVNMTLDNMIGADYGCVDCEQPYELVKNDRCPAEGFDWRYP